MLIRDRVKLFYGMLGPRAHYSIRGTHNHDPEISRGTELSELSIGQV